jgi:hypothetical protein
MSTAQSIPRVPHRFRIGLVTVLIALGVLVAIGVTITMLALTGAKHTTAVNPARPSQASSASTPQTHYLGPHQLQAAAQMQRGSGISTAGVGNSATHYTCLGAAQQCLR